MGLETATYISDLVLTNPTGLDPKRQGDDHLRLLKSTLQNTFPNVTGALNLTETQVNNAAIKIEENTFTQHNFVAAGKAWAFNSTTTGSPLGLGSPVGSPIQSGLVIYNDGNGYILNKTGHLTINTNNANLLLNTRNFDLTNLTFSVRNGLSFRVYDTGGDFLDVTHDGTDIVFTSAGTDSGGANISFDNVVRFEDSIYMKHVSTNFNGDKAGYGQLWVQQGSPAEVWFDHNVLMFTDDDGETTQIGTSYHIEVSVPINGFGSPSPKTSIFLAKTGELVRMFFNLTVSATSTTTDMDTANFVIPSEFRPPVEQHFFVPIINNGSTVMGQMDVQSNGQIEWYNSLVPNPGSATFTASGTKGFYNNTPVIWHTKAGNT